MSMTGKMTIQKHEISWIVESGLPFISKSPFDWTHDFIVTGDGKEFKVIASNQNCYAEFKGTYQGDPVLFAVNGTMFSQVITKEEADTLDILVYDEEIILKRDRRKIKLATDEIPIELLPENEGEMEPIDIFELKHAVDCVQSCVAPAKTSLYEQYKGIVFDTLDDKLTLVATDTVKMSVYKMDVPFNNKVIVASKPLASAVKVLQKFKGGCRIGVVGETLVLKNEYCRFVFPSYDTMFIQWASVIKHHMSEVTGWIEVSTYDFVRALDRVKVLSNTMFKYYPEFVPGASSLFLKIEGDVIYSERLEATITGNVIPFKAEPSALFDIVAPIKEDRLEIGVEANTGEAIVIRPKGSEKQMAFCGLATY